MCVCCNLQGNADGRAGGRGRGRAQCHVPGGHAGAAGAREHHRACVRIDTLTHY